MIPYNSDIWQQDSILHELLITDGTVTVSGTHYSVNGASVTITDDLIDLEAFELDQALCSGSQLQFGRCESGNIKFTMYDNIPSTKGKTLNTYIIPNQDASLMVQLGVFKVHEDKLNSDRTKREVTAYDKMWDINNADVTAWYNSVLPNSSSSMTLQQFRNSFLNYFGVTAESTVLANDLITIRRTIEPETLSGADVLRAICEINGVFGTITNEGKFRFVELSRDLDSGLFPSDTLYPANDLYPQDVNHTVDIIDKSYYINIQFEDYLVESITGLTIRTDDQDVGVTVGTSHNKYVITNNFLVYGYDATALTSVANNILPKIAVRYYRPCVINALGNPLREVGDGLRIKTTYRGVTTYVLERKLTGVQSLRDTYTAQGEQYYSEQLNSVSSQFKQLSGKVMNLKIDTDGIAADVSDLDTREASHYTQTSGQIALKVSKGEVSSEISIESGQVTFSSNRLVVNSTNFILTDTGDATFKGNVTGATITGGTVSGTTITGGTISGTTISGNTITGGTISGTSISGSTITSTSGNNTTTISGGNITSNNITLSGNINISGGELTMSNNAGLQLYHGGIRTTQSSTIANTWLKIDGYNSGVGSSMFSNVAIDGLSIKIGEYSTTDGVNIYNCGNIYAVDDTTDNFIRMNDGGGGLRIQGNSESRIILDSRAYLASGIAMRADTIDIGTSGTDVKIQGQSCEWVKLSDVGNNDYVLIQS